MALNCARRRRTIIQPAAPGSRGKTCHRDVGSSLPWEALRGVRERRCC